MSIFEEYGAFNKQNLCKKLQCSDRRMDEQT